MSPRSRSCGKMARVNMIEDPECMEHQPVIYRKVLLRIVFCEITLTCPRCRAKQTNQE